MLVTPEDNNTRQLQQTIRENVGLAASFEQLAEESCELGQAALKFARALREENPTPEPNRKLRDNLIEECTDVLLCMDTLRLAGDSELALKKLQRWIKRLADKNGDA